MEMTLTFNDITLSPVTHQNNLWIRAVELSKALGFKREDQAAKIYRAHVDEFTSDMAQVVEISDNADSAFPVKSLRFTLRGCHLLAMFARTPVAKSFRRWVLDVLDKLAEQERARLAGEVKEIPDASRSSTTSSRKPLRALVHAWAQVSGVSHTALWPQVKAHFQLERIDDLPEEWLPDALAFVQGKIDQCGKALPPSPPTDRESLTVAPAIEPASEQALATTTLDAKTYACGKQFFDDVNKLRLNAEGIREALHIFARPGGRSVFLPHEKQMLYDNANEAANVAVTSLNQAIYALRMIYNIKAHVSFSR